MDIKRFTKSNEKYPSPITKGCRNYLFSGDQGRDVVSSGMYLQKAKY
jgi:hypothetical protein